ncbi:hypothetical protein QTH97_32425 [Variovorax sp. J22R24]|uniref:hypothetical protein n=1 Tax=Variovorax gracilis TaxID=3053502 RepID=UPI0025766FDB|nr:hypothetical protein [Variovorax sp. J22R24]MDM0109665.1 hypothetical protein [Variovorax sp. J22R24]
MGYRVKMQDNAGNYKTFHSDNAPKHVQGNALASALVIHLNATYPASAPFSTREVTPKEIRYDQDIDVATDAVWP